MRPALNEGVTAEDFFHLAGWRRVQMKELHVMSRIDLMHRDNIGGVMIKRGEPFLFFLRRPIFFGRCDVVISLGGALLEWTWSIHRCKRGGAQVLRGLFYFRANLRRNSNQLMAHNVLTKVVQVLGNIRDQFV